MGWQLGQCPKGIFLIEDHHRDSGNLAHAQAVAPVFRSQNYCGRRSPKGAEVPWEPAKGPREIHCVASDTRVLARGQGALLWTSPWKEVWKLAWGGEQPLWGLPAGLVVLWGLGT